jgi:hypothetical protein
MIVALAAERKVCHGPGEAKREKFEMVASVQRTLAMHRAYRLSTIGAKLPRHYSYGPIQTAANCRAGFEAFKGPIYSIANSIGPAIGALSESDFTPSVGYDLLLLIDVRNYRGHEWAPWTWFVILPEDVGALRSLAVRDLHAWLREHPACLGADGQLSREAVVAWVRDNKNEVEAWLEQRSQEEPTEFIETFSVMSQG